MCAKPGHGGGEGGVDGFGHYRKGLSQYIGGLRFLKEIPSMFARWVAVSIADPIVLPRARAIGQGGLQREGHFQQFYFAVLMVGTTVHTFYLC